MDFKLTNRETEIVGSLIDGNSAPKIAKDFGLSLHTIKNHIRHIRLKTGSRTIAEAVAKILKPINNQ